MRPPSRRSLGLEPLERRAMLAAVSWDGGGDNLNWTDPLNWSSDSVPGPADDVTIGGAFGVQHASGSHTILSLTSAGNLSITGGTISVTTGASSISGALTINAGTLQANGATAVLTATGSVSLAQAGLSAIGGGQLDLSTATSYAQNLFQTSVVQATGTGSLIDLSGVTSLTGNGSTDINALAGGVVQLDALTTLTANDVDVTADGTGSTVDLAMLATWAPNSVFSSLNVSNGGAVQAPLLASFVRGTITVSNMSAAFPAMTNVDGGSLFVSGAGASLTMAGLTAYDQVQSGLSTFQANGAGATLDLSNLSSITGAIGSVDVNALAGSTVKLDDLTTLSANDTDILVDGTGSVVDMPTLITWAAPSVFSQLTVANGGSALVPLLSTFERGIITVNNMTAAFPVITDLDGGSLFVTGAGASLTMAGLTAYNQIQGGLSTFQANGAGSVLDLSNLASITGAIGSVDVNALAGGTVKLDSLTTLSARDTDILVDGTGSVVDMPILITWSAPSVFSQLTVANGGSALVPLLSTFERGIITANNMTAAFPVITDLDGGSLFVTGAGSSLTMAGLTAYDQIQNGLSTFQANGAGSVLDLSNLASITGTFGSVDVNGQAGGTVKLDSLTTLSARDTDILVDGTGSVVDMPILTAWTPFSVFSQLTVSNGGNAQVPLMSSFERGTITVINMTAAFPVITDLDGGSLFVSGAGSSLTMAGLTSYTQIQNGLSTFQANGAGSLLDLTNLSSITGTMGSLDVNAQGGGNLTLVGLTTLTTRDVDILATASGSVVDISSLPAITDVALQSSIVVANSGNVTMSPGTVALAGVAVVPLSSGTIDGGTLELGGSSQLNGNGGTVNANISNLTGLVSLGDPSSNPGTAAVVGNFSAAAAGTFAVQINGPTAGTNYDQLVVQGTVSLAGPLTITRGYTPTIGESWTIIDNDGADPVVGTFELSPEGDIYTVNGLPFQLSYVGGDGNDVTLTRVENIVVGRRIFYNQSSFDGNNPDPNAADDNAIATDKSALLPGAGIATFANITSYSRGINGIMVDLSGPHGTLTPADFTFVMSEQVGANNTPSTWAVAPPPASISVRSGAGYRGADRIDIVWAAGTISNRWLQVLSQGNDTAGGNNTNTGLPASDIFYFGNRIGDTGSGAATLAITSALDEIAARNNTGFGATVTNLYDFDRSGLVTAVDPIISRNNIGTLTKINITNPPAAPLSGDGDGSAIAWALTVPAADSLSAGPTLSGVLDTGPGDAATLVEPMVDAPSAIADAGDAVEAAVFDADDLVDWLVDELESPLEELL